MMKGLCTAILMAIPAIAAAQAPSVSTSAVTIGDSQFQCVNHAQAALKAGGFDENLTVKDDQIFGRLGNFTALMFCQAPKRQVFIVVSGPNVEGTARFRNLLRDQY